MASLVSTTVNGDLKVTGSSNLFFEGSASSNTFEPGTRIYGAGITLTGGAYTSVFEYTVPGGLAGNFRFFVKGTTGNVVVPTQVDVLLNHSKDITIKSQTGNYTPLHVKVLTNNNEDCLVQIKADTSGNANVTVYIDVIAFGDGSVSFSSFGSYTGTSLEHKCNFGFSFSTINNTDASKFVMDGGNTDGGRLGIGTNSPAQPLDVLGKVSINSDGTLNWGAAKDYGRLTWSTTNSRAIVRGETGKNLSLGANGTQDYLFIKTDGNVGIGTTNPTTPLHVVGNTVINGDLFFGSTSGSFVTTSSSNLRLGGDNGIKLQTYSGGWQDRLTIIDNGNVGIGTVSPDNPLEVFGADSGIKISSDASDRPHLRFECGTAEKLRLSANANYGAIGDSSNTNRYMVLKDGNVGIATDAPSSLLHVGSAGAAPHAAANDFVIAPSATDVGMTIRCNSNSGTGSIFFADTAANAQGLIRYNHNSDYMSFYSSGDFFFDTGSVGIGTNDPQRALDVDGRVRADTYGFRSDTPLRYYYFDDFGGSNLIGRGGNAYTSLYDSGALSMAWKGGKVGIGTTNPNGKLTIHTGTNTNGLLIYEDTNDSLTHNLYIDSNDQGILDLRNASNAVMVQLHTGGSSFFTGGSLGIGTSTPDSKLEIAGGGYNSSLKIKGSGADTGIQFEDSAGNTDGYIYANGGMIGFLDAGTHWMIQCKDDDYIKFLTNNGTEHMRITSDGNVGIGETDPDKPLHIKGTNTAGIVIENTTNATNMDIDWYNNVGSVAGRIRYSEGTGDFTFMPNQSTAAVMFKYNGNVGINTSSPSAKLHVESDGSHNEGAEIALRHANNNTTDIVSTISFQNNGGQVAMIQAGTTGANNTGYISLFTDNAGTSSEKVRIIGDGNVGIGTTNPAAQLDLHAGNMLIGDSYLDHHSTNDNYGLQIKSIDATQVALELRSNGGSNAAGTWRATLYGASGYYGFLDGAWNNWDIRKQVDGPLLIDQGSGLETVLTTATAIVDGSGTADYITRWSDTDTVGNSNIFDNGTIGIGTAADLSGKVTIRGQGNSVGDHHIFCQLSHSAVGYGASIFLKTSTTNTNNRYGARITSIRNANNNAAADLAFSLENTGATALEEKVRITSDGHVGIGTTNPSNYSNTAARDLVINRADHAGITIYSSAANKSGNIYFADAGSLFAGYISYNHNGDSMLLGINSTTRLQIEETALTYTSSDGSGLIVERTSNSAYLQFYPAYSSVPTIMGKGAGGLHLSYNSSTSGIRINTSNKVIINDTATTNNNNAQLYVNGPVYGSEFDLPSGGAIDWANGDARIVEGLASNYSLSLQNYDGSSAMVTTMFLKSGGRVGIGTNDPLSRFNILGTQGNWRVDPDSVSNEIQVLSTTVANDGFRTFRLRTNETAFDTGGSERIRIKSDGKVGIGTTNPTNNLVVYATGHQVNFVTETDDHSGMRVKGAAAKDKYILFNDQAKIGYQHSTGTLHLCRSAAFGDNHLVIDSSGNVGIGIGTPDGVLNVKSTGDGVNVLNLVDSSGDAMFNVRQSGNDGLVRVYKDGGLQKVQLHTDGRSYFTGGSVGVGTAEPNKSFQVNWSSTNTTITTGNGLLGGAAGGGVLIQNTSSAAGIYANLDFRAYDADARIAVKKAAGNTGDFYFIHDDDGSANTSVVMRSNGSVGIGTTAPGSRLEVYNGSIWVKNSGTNSFAYIGEKNGPNPYVFGGTTIFKWVTRNSAGSSVLAYSALAVDSDGHLLISNGTGAYTARIAISASTGHVGIGTTAHGTDMLKVNGSIVGTSKSFDITHPNPEEAEKGKRLRHVCIEAPTADTLYRFEVESETDDGTVTYQLPSYFKYLNRDAQIWVQPKEMFAQAYGVFNEDCTAFTLRAEKAGRYNVLIVATRTDIESPDPEYTEGSS